MQKSALHGATIPEWQHAFDQLRPAALSHFSFGCCGCPCLEGVGGLPVQFGDEQRADIGPNAICVCPRKGVQDSLGPERANTTRNEGKIFPLTLIIHSLAKQLCVKCSFSYKTWQYALNLKHFSIHHSIWFKLTYFLWHINKSFKNWLVQVHDGFGHIFVMSQSGYESFGLVVVVLDQRLPRDVVLTLKKVTHATKVKPAPWSGAGLPDGGYGTCTSGGLKPML